MKLEAPEERFRSLRTVEDGGLFQHGRLKDTAIFNCFQAAKAFLRRHQFQCLSLPFPETQATSDPQKSKNSTFDVKRAHNAHKRFLDCVQNSLFGRRSRSVLQQPTPAFTFSNETSHEFRWLI